MSTTAACKARPRARSPSTIGLDYSVASVQIDANASPADIAKQLAKLEATGQGAGCGDRRGEGQARHRQAARRMGGQAAEQGLRAGARQRRGALATAKLILSHDRQRGAALPALRRHHAAQPRKGSPSSGGAPTGAARLRASANGGRCRKAAWTKARRPSRPRVASYSRRPACAASASSRAPRTGFSTICREHLIGVAWEGRYRGQKQMWFAARLEGPESEIRHRAARRP